MAELGSTTDPCELVPGSVSALADLVWQLRGYAEALATAGDGLARIDTAEGWQGAAADRFRHTYQSQPHRWREAGDAFATAATALDRYTSTLSWAQARAADAVELFARGEHQSLEARMVDAGLHTHRLGSPRIAVLPPFHDPGEATRAAAREMLEHARLQLRDSGDDERHRVTTVCGLAPEEPTPWDALGSAAGEAGTWLLHGTQDVGIAAVNGLASFGNAMVQHPADTAAMLGGLMLMGVSGLGEAGGLTLDATGVGAVVGVPLNAVATAGLVAGATIAGTGATSLAMHASSDSRVSPLEARADEAGPGARGRPGTKTDRCREHLTRRDLDAARRELDGEVVATKPDGTPWNHVGEVRDAQRGLANRIDQLKRLLADSRVSDEVRGAAQSELSEASRLLDYSRQFVPPTP